MSILETLKQAEAVKPLMTKNGIKVVSFEDAKLLSEAERIEGVPDTGIRAMNPDGSMARSRVTVAGVNKDVLYENRYRLIKEGEGKDEKAKIQIVVDKRAIKDQSTGKIYTARVPAYQIIRERGKLKVEKVLTVSDIEFIGDFNSKAGEKDMVEILPLLDNAERDITVTSIEI